MQAKEFLTRKEAAQYLTGRGLPTSPNTLQKLVSTGGGPLYQRFGKLAVYRPENLDAFAAAKLGEPRHTARRAA